MNIEKKYCGYITIIGKTNVGKSTLINQIIGKKISIVSRKKNTTQHNVTGIITEKINQFIYIDTPGMHFNQKNNVMLETYNNFYKEIHQSELIIFIVDRNIWTDNDQIIANKIKKMNLPILIGINKIDKLSNKNVLLPHIKFLKEQINAIEIIPISAKKNKNILLFNKIIKFYLPEKSHVFNSYESTTNSQFFTISEIIRETLISFLGDELPSIIKVYTKSIEKRNRALYINATIYVNNVRQKKIVIGHHAELIKKCNIISRYTIEKLLKTNIHLFLQVKENTLKHKK